MDTTSQGIKAQQLFRKNTKGEIVVVGSGDYFRSQKKHFLQYKEPFKQLYKEQVESILKDAPKELRTIFSLK